MKKYFAVAQRIPFVLAVLLSLMLSGCDAGELVSRNNSNDTVSVSQSGYEVQNYSGTAYEEVDGNQPGFTSKEKQDTSAFETYSDLDSLGRCGVAFANICQEIMPTEKRGEIGSVRPSGWHTVKYPGIVDGNYLYNRCHLIGYQLAGENANEKNLITGTRYLNVTGMLPFEDEVADYVKETGNHVLYRVTPEYTGDNLVADGVRMEAYSVEDQGEGVCFHVFVYNVQPGIEIDYATGESQESTGESQESTGDSQESTGESQESTGDSQESAGESQKSTGKSQARTGAVHHGENTEKHKSSSDTTCQYIINENTGKFHLSTCSSVGDIYDDHRKKYQGNREDLIDQGYEACKRCNP